MSRSSSQARRRGLSTLEMVLSLPILLFVMALMINYGTVACWKVRALSVARNAVWSTRWPRTGHSDPRPEYWWPERTSVDARAAGSVPALDDPRVDQPVARGPLMLGTTVHEELLDPTRGLRRGSAGITREFPLLAKMGAYHLEARAHLLDDKWQYQRMRWPEQGYWLVSNVQRRIPVIYALAKAPAKVVDAYYQAAVALLESPLRPQLAPLDRDDEFIYYGDLFGWGRGAPDFHPRVRRFCSLDPELADRNVEQLTDRIRGKVTRDAQGNVTRRIPSVAERMAGAFIRLYRRVIQQYRGQIGMETQIAALEAKIDILTQFVATLRSNDDN